MGSRIFVVHDGTPEIKWKVLALDLSHVTNVAFSGILKQMDVRDPIDRLDGQIAGYPNMLILGDRSFRYVLDNTPVGLRFKELPYGADRPKLFTIETTSGFGNFGIALYFPNPYNGTEVYSGCCFLLQTEPIRDRLIIHQTRHVYAPHEPSIFGSSCGVPPPRSHGSSQGTGRTRSEPGRNAPAAEGIEEEALPF